MQSYYHFPQRVWDVKMIPVVVEMRRYIYVVSISTERITLVLADYKRLRPLLQIGTEQIRERSLEIAAPF